MGDTRNRNIIIAVVVILLLCCCCSTVAGLWQFGDALTASLNF
jgi:hypothetical protein